MYPRLRKRTFMYISVFGIMSTWCVVQWSSKYALHLQEAPLQEYLNTSSKGESVQVTDQIEFSFITNFKDICSKHRDLFVLAVVHASPEKIRNRQLIRDTWGSASLYSRTKTKVLFFSGIHDDINVRKSLKREADKHKDIVIQSYRENYKNQTYKTIAWLKWTVEHCPNVSFVLKGDDDVFVNIFELVKSLNSSKWRNDRLLCNEKINDTVNRNPRNKYYVSFEEFGKDRYPNHCAGLAYIIPESLIPRLHENIKYEKLIWLDHIYLTGLVRERSKLEISGINDVYTKSVIVDEFKRGKKMFAQINVNDKNVHAYWNALMLKYTGTTMKDTKIITKPNMNYSESLKNLSLYTDIVNRHDYAYVKSLTDTCSKNPGIFILHVVHTAPNHHKHRKYIRQTRGNSSVHLKMATLFFIGIPGNTKELIRLFKEAEEYKDIVIQEYKDSYRNLTLKAMSWLQWVVQYCPQAAYILKTDDDVFVNTFQVFKFLNVIESQSKLGRRDNIMCSIRINNGVIRSKSKWYVSKAEYSDDKYPPHCPGFAVIIGSDAVRRLHNASYYVPFFWIDDVYFTGVLRLKANITITRINGRYTNMNDAGGLINGTKLFAHAAITDKRLYTFWNLLKDKYVNTNVSSNANSTESRIMGSK
ncbi:Uncharacterised protein r2_g2449 [Pycnogonum litorale]